MATQANVNIEKIANSLLEKVTTAIENGERNPFTQPWNNISMACANAISKNAYSGKNQLILGFVAMTMGYKSPFWVTFKQAQSLGTTVEKGQKGSPICFYQKTFILDGKFLNEAKYKLLSKDKQKDCKSFLMLKTYTVFNIDQCEAFEGSSDYYPSTNIDRVNNPIEACETMLNGYSDIPTISHDYDYAAYNSGLDIIKMPQMAQFHSSESYYSTLWHEAAHSTGHKSRLGRELGTGFGTEKYSREELVAEFSAGILCGMAGIEKVVEDSSIAYLQGWVSYLKNDPSELFHALAEATKAVEYMLGKNKKPANE